MPPDAGRIAAIEAENAALRRELVDLRDDLAKVLAATAESDAAAERLIRDLFGQVEKLQGNVSDGNSLLHRQDVHIDDLISLQPSHRSRSC